MKWSHIILEGFCAKDWEYNSKHSKYQYHLLDIDKDTGKFKTEKIDNPDYDPKIKKPKYPHFCKKHICYTCLENDCPHLSYCEGNKKDIIDYYLEKKMKKYKY